MSGISGISGYSGYSYTQSIMGAPNRRGKDDLFDKVDTDSSGGISKTELDALAAKISEGSGTTISTGDAISTYDTNGDGELSSSELKSFMDANRPAETPMDMAGMMGMSMQGMGMMGRGPSPEEMFGSMDSDGSGGLSQAELDALASQISEDLGTTLDTTDAIAAYDADGDGELGMEEVQSFLDASGVKPSGPPPMGQKDGSSSEDLLQGITDNAISTYDEDGNGELSSTELLNLLKGSAASTYSADYIIRALTSYTYGSTDSSLSLEI
jgi:Ca2+-binding EF-hand superfamily protein